MPDRRIESRRATGRLPLVGGLTRGRLVNLSASGFAIETDRGLRIGEYCGFSIRRESREPGERASGGLPPTLTPRILAISTRFVGTVRWCSLHRTIRWTNGEVSPVFRAGVEFDPKGEKTPKDTDYIDFSLPPT